MRTEQPNAPTKLTVEPRCPISSKLPELGGRYHVVGKVAAAVVRQDLADHIVALERGREVPEAQVLLHLGADAVNLAARVEGMTKHYHCRVLVSGATRQALDDTDRFALREVDTNRAVGRTEPMTVLQLVDAEDESTRADLKKILERFARGLADYRKGAFEGARARFEEILSEVDDGPARWLRERCQAYATAPPADWDGVTVLERK